MRTAGEAKLAAGDEGPKAINLKENSEVSESQENQLTDQMDIGESSLSKIDDNSFKNKERDCSSKTIEIEFEEEEKKISEGSLDSDSFRHWSKIIEESKFSTEERNFDPEELNRQLLYTKFQSDPEFQKSTSEIIKKIVSFHKEKEIIECTSHIKTVNNLIFLHLKRLIKTNKVLDIDSKTQMEYYYYIFEKTINLGLFT